jgi:NADH-quinone oxidoreductase subunit F
MTQKLSIGKLEWFRNKIRAAQARDKTVVHVCMTGCRAYGASEILTSLNDEVRRQGLTQSVEVRATGCHGFCAKAPVIAVEPLGIQYQEVTPEDAAEITDRTLKGGHLIERLAYKDPRTQRPIFYCNQIPFYQKQERRVLAHCGRIDPCKIEHYIAAGGYQAVVKALSMPPEKIIAQVSDAKLRGRGGAGFPTGRKWHFARQARGHPKYLICNADEGDPGAFMDRAILEGDPHAMLEGMIIGAYAIGAQYGYIYVREEYPIAVEHLKIALAQAEAFGLLGADILGTGLDFHLSIKMGAGAFVCGEGTALIASIEGKRGMPRSKPPRTTQSGINGLPTNMNNVETWANVPLIIQKGVSWYTKMGTALSGGTKIFSLAGKVNNTGLVEVPIGASIKKVIFDIGGGIPKGRKFKAVQMGGPSGGCVPKQYINVPIDYETIERIGAIMGSGGLVVMDENNCMVEIARFFLSFTQSESCGKCTPCRLGSTQLLEILTRISSGRGRIEDIETLKELGSTISETSLCGLGQACAKPVLSTLKYFLKEYEDHILENRCAGASCEAMVISACQHACPAGIDVPNYIAAIATGKYQQAVDIIRERNPFPAVCGRICIHPCEFKCRRGELDEPVAIRALKRFASDWYFENIGMAAEPYAVTRPQKIAIVGAGPAGLTCAYFMAQVGYAVTVFEMQAKGGGMLNIAVPEFRLPRLVIQDEIAYIESCGVEIRYDAPIDARHTVNDLIKEGYSAVFIAAGAQASVDVSIPGAEEDLEGLYHGLQFLTEIRGGQKLTLNGRVVVIGGGNVAMDVARTALRLGADDVQIFYRRSLEEMPAWQKEIEEASEEGIVINTLWSPKEILHEGREAAALPRSLTALFEDEDAVLHTGGQVTGVEFVRSRNIFDEHGRSYLGADENTTQIVDAETVIIAIGQAPDTSFLSADSQLERNLWGRLDVDNNRLATNVDGIFAGGDFTAGPTTVIEAVASGRRAALAIAKYLKKEKGRVKIMDEKTAMPENIGLALDDESAADRARVRSPIEKPAARVRDFREVEKGFTQVQAQSEAMRCLRCDLEKERSAV